MVPRRDADRLRVDGEQEPIVYIQSLASGQRQVLANFRGSNSAPAWAPDGRKLAVTLTKEGGSQIFLINPDGSGAQRILTSQGIDTEANFTPDGQSLLFTSDRGGSPQIYRLDLRTNAVERLTFDGSYNVSARATPDGKGFVFVRREGGPLQPGDPGLRDAAGAGADLGFARRKPERVAEFEADPLRVGAGGRGILAAVSSDGRVKQRLVAPTTDVREPAWDRCRVERIAALTAHHSGDNHAQLDHRGTGRGIRRRLQEHRDAAGGPHRRAAPGSGRRGGCRRRLDQRRRRLRRQRHARGRRGDESPQGSEEHPVEADRLLRFRRFVVKDEFRGVIDAHAKYLQANRSARMTLQGHADERGSREYNIALGQKRADA